MKDWAAKLHFTIAIDDTASLNPGATFVHALAPAGSAAQSFTLRVGAGASTEAVHQEDYEYLISFTDLTAEFDDVKNGELYNLCHLEGGLLLKAILDWLI